MQSVYSFGREERLQSAYEVALQNEKIELRGNSDGKYEDGKNRIICSSIKRKAN